MAEHRSKKEICPGCGEKTVVRIIYGMPSVDVFEAAELGELMIGGCVVSFDNPSRGCTACGWPDGVGDDA